MNSEKQLQLLDEVNKLVFMGLKIKKTILEDYSDTKCLKQSVKGLQSIYTRVSESIKEDMLVNKDGDLYRKSHVRIKRDFDYIDQFFDSLPRYYHEDELTEIYDLLDHYLNHFDD